MLVDQDSKLATKLSLLVGIGHPAIGRHARHILNDGKTHLITRSVEKIRFYLDLFLELGIKSKKKNARVIY